MPFNDVQTASAEHAHDTPHHDLHGMLHALDDTVLSETFCRHATDVLHLLVLALHYAFVAKNHLHADSSSTPADSGNARTSTSQETETYEAGEG